MDRPRPWHPFRHTGLCGLRGTTCVLSLIAIITVLLITVLFPHPVPTAHDNTTTNVSTPIPPFDNSTMASAHRVKRSATASVPLAISHPCSDPYVTLRPTICVPQNSSTVITIPFVVLNSKDEWGPHKGKSYSQNKWYMTDYDNTRWEDLLADEGNEWTPSYKASKTATPYKGMMSLVRIATGLLITVDNTKNQLAKGEKQGNRSCVYFKLWAYASGHDPYFVIRLCQMPPNTTNQPRSVQKFGIKVYNTPRTSKDLLFSLATGVSEWTNNWLLMVEQGAKDRDEDCVVCLGPRPLLRIVPVPTELNASCILQIMTKDVPNSDCQRWDSVYPLTRPDKQKPLFSTKVAKNNFTCVNGTGGTPNRDFGQINPDWCTTYLNIGASPLPKMRSDIWWYCGGKTLRGNLPANFTGTCALVSLVMPLSIMPVDMHTMLLEATQGYIRDTQSRRKREETEEIPDPTYIDAIGVPRGVPDEYKIADQVSAGFESILCWWCTINKNVDRINYVHFNVQKLGNFTERGFTAVHEQLSATSLFAFQNRIALDMILAEKGGVCSMFGEQCCTFIPNNTAADGSLTRALQGMKALNRKMKEHSGVDTSFWDDWLSVFGRWKALVAAILMSIAVFAAILILCGCCCIPCIRALITRVVDRAIAPTMLKYSSLPLNGDITESPNPMSCQDDISCSDSDIDDSDVDDSAV